VGVGIVFTTHGLGVLDQVWCVKTLDLETRTLAVAAAARTTPEGGKTEKHAMARMAVAFGKRREREVC